jgi:alanyl-tRNA synthetase
MHRLVPALVAEMGAAYPELVRGAAAPRSDLAQEETRFPADFGHWLKAADEATGGAAGGRQRFAGETAF